MAFKMKRAGGAFDYGKGKTHMKKVPPTPPKKKEEETKKDKMKTFRKKVKSVFGDIKGKFTADRYYK